MNTLDLFMGYRTRIRGNKKAFQKKDKNTEKWVRHTNKQGLEEEKESSQQQFFEITLKRLHTLGNQKFGASPFSEHFDRWLRTVETVLDEFETQPDINIDKQFTEERNQILETIKLQLENHRQKEAISEMQIVNVSNIKKRLRQTNKEYLAKTVILRRQKITTLKQLNKEIEALKEEQNQIVKLKTGFFRGISKKERELKEAIIVQRYTDKQQEFEIKTLEFKEKQRQLKEEYESKRDPLLENVKNLQKCTKEMEEDRSLEERWFACESLKDTLNNFLLRK
jgi:hypothetical protein